MPAGFLLEEVVTQAKAIAAGHSEIAICETPEAVRAHAVYTDVWASMGQEEERAPRASLHCFVDEALMGHADAEAIVLRCLPAHRGEEISAEVMEGSSNRIMIAEPLARPTGFVSNTFGCRG